MPGDQFKYPPVATLKHLSLTMVATKPSRGYGVDDIAAWQVEARRDNGLAGIKSPKLSAGGFKLATSGGMDRARQTATG